MTPAYSEPEPPPSPLSSPPSDNDPCESCVHENFVSTKRTPKDKYTKPPKQNRSRTLSSSPIAASTNAGTGADSAPATDDSRGCAAVAAETVEDSVSAVEAGDEAERVADAAVVDADEAADTLEAVAL